MTNYNFSCDKQIFINESLTKTNKSLTLCGRKLKHSGLIHSCYTKDGVVHIKKSEHAKVIKVHHINSLYGQFSEFFFLMMMMMMMMMMTVIFFLMLHQTYQVNLHID